MEPAYYEFNSSQDVIRLQTKYTIFKRVQNILFFTVVEKGFDMDLMKRAIDRMIERNDCLRIKFVDKGGRTLQYFVPQRSIGKIPYREFPTERSFTRFMDRFRVKSTDCYKDDVLRVVFARNADNRQMIIFKISHYVADTYGIGVLMNDLFAVYSAMEKGEELPPAPGSFEEVLKNDNAFKQSDDSVARDMEFFRDLYNNVHKTPARYCGIHGNRSDRWLKYKRKGYIYLPYLFVRCETEGYRFTIPSAVAGKAAAWCESSGYTMSAFFYSCYAITTSLLNDRTRFQMPLELLNSRATLAERKAAGTKVQSISLYTETDYDRSFSEGMAALKAEQGMIYRHTRLSYIEVEKIFHKAWDFSMLGQLNGFCYSFIPMSSPEGVDLQVYSNGRGSLPVYVALMYDIRTKEINMVYDVQKRMIKPAVLIDFQNLYLHVIEAVLANPDCKLSEIL